MRRRWRVAAFTTAGLATLALGGFAWLILTPAKPAEVVEAGRTGKRITTDAVFGNYYAAPKQGPGPAVLLLGGSEGGLGHDVRAEALLLQAAGFNVLHLGYFNVPGRPSRLDAIPLETFAAGLDWLRGRPEVDGGRIAIVGYSKGAEAALLVATRYRGVRAVVAGMPSSVAWDALSIPGFLFGRSSWTYGGRAVPSLSYGSGDGRKELLPRFENALARLSEHPETIIPVERFEGRMLLICGGRDTLWPSCRMARDIASRLESAGRPAPAFLDYSEAGHGVMGAPLPASTRDLAKWTMLGGTAQANAAARRDGWPRIVAFLTEALAEPPRRAANRVRPGPSA